MPYIQHQTAILHYAEQHQHCIHPSFTNYLLHQLANPSLHQMMKPERKKKVHALKPSLPNKDVKSWHYMIITNAPIVISSFCTRKLIYYSFHTNTQFLVLHHAIHLSFHVSCSLTVPLP